MGWGQRIEFGLKIDFRLGQKYIRNMGIFIKQIKYAKEDKIYEDHKVAG